MSRAGAFSLWRPFVLLGAFFALTQAIIRALQAGMAAMINRRTVTRLSDLDDYLLKDIGITRQELNAALYQAGFLDDPSLKLGAPVCQRKAGADSH